MRNTVALKETEIIRKNSFDTFHLALDNGNQVT